MREALARAAFERADASSKDGGGRYAGDGFLEVLFLFSLFGFYRLLSGLYRSRTWRNWHRRCCSISEGICWKPGN